MRAAIILRGDVPAVFESGNPNGERSPDEEDNATGADKRSS